MTEAGTVSVLRRKLDLAAASAPAGIAHALGQAVAKAAHRLFDLPVRTVAAFDTDLSPVELPEVLEDRALLMLLDGPGGALGLMVVGAPLLAALTEVQLAGRLGARPPPDRRPTRTDAAMAAEFVDMVLSGPDEDPGGAPDRTWASGFRFGRWVDDPRPLPLMLEEAPMRALKLTLRIGPDEDREGSMLLVLPAAGFAAFQAAPDVDDAGWCTRLGGAVSAASVPVSAVLARVHLSVKELGALRPGMSLPLPPDSVARVALESAPGRILMRGRLGRARGMRALRLCDPVAGDVPDPAWRTRPAMPPLDGLVPERSAPSETAADERIANGAAPHDDRLTRAAG